MENKLDNVPTLPLTCHEKLTLCSLCFISLTNYMDRYGLAAVLVEIQDEYNVGNDRGGLLKAAFIVPYSISALLFGYLGDRHTRRVLLTCCVVCRHVMSLLGSMSPNYTLLFISRIGAGVSESGFAVVAPVVISDIVFSRARTLWITAFSIFTPVGCGLGFVIAGSISKSTGMWWWGLRFAPLLGLWGSVLLWFSIYPERGEKEAAALGGKPVQPTGFGQDICYLIRLPTFICNTVGSAFTSFVTGATTWWMPTLFYLALKVVADGAYVDPSGVGLKIGIVTVIGGVAGVVISFSISRCLRYKFEWIDPTILGIALLLALPCFIASIFLAHTDIDLGYIFGFFGVLNISVHWPLTMDMLLYTIIPPRRCTGLALHLLLFHIFGDAISPYIVGSISEALKDSSIFQEGKNQEMLEYKSMRVALLNAVLALLPGGIAYLVNSCYIVNDWTKARKETLQAVTT